MQILVHLASSCSCALSVVGSVKGDVRVFMALWWNPCGSGESLGPEKAAARASELSVALFAGVDSARSCSNAVWLFVGGEEMEDGVPVQENPVVMVDGR